MQQYQDKLQKNLLAELRMALDEEALTQKSLGKALGLKQSAVSTLLSGKSKMTLAQYFIICDLLGREPSTFLQRASSRSQQEVFMTPQIENTLYKSDLHILLYVAATREIDPQDIDIPDIGRHHLRQCFEELVAVGLLKKKGGCYVQKNPNLIYKSYSRLANSKLHQKIVARSWNTFDTKLQDANFLSDKFNYYLVDRFTFAQAREIYSELWKVYEKIQSIQKENLFNNYSTKEQMPLWNIHAMLMTPVHLQEK